MNSVYKKLHLIDQDPVLVLNAPEEYYNQLEELGIEIHDEVQDDYHYIQVFAQDEEEAQEVIREVIGSLLPKAYFWFTYPKENSENFDTELDEDSIIEIFYMFDLEGVTKVSINDDWQAMRLKPGEVEEDDYEAHIKGPRKFNNSSD